MESEWKVPLCVLTSIPTFPGMMCVGFSVVDVCALWCMKQWIDDVCCKCG